MADLSEYPRFLCKPGTSEDAWGYRVDTSFATSPEHEAEMLRRGWFRQPGDWEKEKPRLPQLDHDGDGKPGGSKPKLSIKTEGDAK